MSKVDYRQMLHGEKPAKEAITRQWWKLAKDEIANSIESVMTQFAEHQGRRQTQILISSRLYGNLSLLGLSGISYSRVATVQSQIKDRITYNVCQSVVDTVTSKIAKNRPKPYFLTSGGDYKTQRKAIKLGKFVDGCFYENEMYRLGPEIFRDGCVWGDGCVYVYSENGKIKVERVLISELYVDEVEGFYGKPRQLHRVKNIDREVLSAAFPKHKTAIMTATRAKPDGASTVDDISDQVTVVESWHLPSSQTSKDGLHAITIPGVTLHEEPYAEDRFPFAFFQWSKRLYGFYGQGLVEQIQNIQTEINKLLWVIQRSMHLAGSFKVLLENGSKIVKEHLNNDIGAIVNYTGSKPDYITPPIVPPEIYAHLMTLKNAAYEQAGISQLSAAAKKPEGLNSGKALREYNDIESDRFMTVGQAYENFFLDVANLMIIEAKKLYKDDKKFAVTYPGKKFIETIPWKDVNMEEDQYVMQIFPVSKLPDDPAGRLQTVQEMMQAGLISPQTGRRLLDYPDLEAEESLANAEEELLHDLLEKIIENEEYNPPEPTDNLALAEKMTLEYIAKGRKDGLEEHKLDMLRTFLTQVKLLVQKASQPDPSAAPGLQPQAVPQGPPQSDLLPNVLNPVAA